jgi:hypothetical protein
LENDIFSEMLNALRNTIIIIALIRESITPFLPGYDYPETETKPKNVKCAQDLGSLTKHYYA